MTGDRARWTDLADKLDRVADVGRRAGVESIVLREPANLTWLLGARVNVPQTLDTACLDVVVQLGPTASPPTLTVVTNAIEAPRLRDTELAGLEDACTLDWQVVPWWTGREERLPNGPGVGCDRALDGTRQVGPMLAELRRELTGWQRGLLAQVCRDSADAATVTAGLVEPGMSGYRVAGAFAQQLLERELDPIVLLVGGADRLDAHRHPLPLSEPVGDRVLLVACGRRHGLVASVSRIVSFTELTSEETRTYADLLAVERAFLDASRPGARLGDVVAAGCRAYADNGFDPDEWHRHHQGGLSGFVPREFPASSASDVLLAEGHVVAWNPSARGWKVEDTALVTADGPQPLVHDDTWPSVTVGGRTRPGVLVRT